MSSSYIAYMQLTANISIKYNEQLSLGEGNEESEKRRRERERDLVYHAAGWVGGITACGEG